MLGTVFSIENQCWNVSCHIFDVVVCLIAPNLLHHEKACDVCSAALVLEIYHVRDAKESST